jgi:hypothetical protein
MDGEFDLEEGVDGEKQVAAAVEDYSVTQHPILYNPLRGSSGSFRISRTAKPVAFGEGEEGLIYLNGQEVELRYDDNGNHNNDGDGYQSGSEQDYEEDGDFECDNDVTVQGSEVGERNDLLSEHNSSSSNSRHHGNLDEFTMSDSTADTIAPDPMEEM